MYLFKNGDTCPCCGRVIEGESPDWLLLFSLTVQLLHLNPGPACSSRRPYQTRPWLAKACQDDALAQKIRWEVLGRFEGALSRGEKLTLETGAALGFSPPAPVEKGKEAPQNAESAP